MIQLRKVLPPLWTGVEVLFRCPDDGWYYPGRIAHVCGDFSYIVKDGNGFDEQIFREDMFHTNQDERNTLAKDDWVLVEHPKCPNSFCPSRIKQVEPKIYVYLFGVNTKEYEIKANDKVIKIPKMKGIRDRDQIKPLAEKWRGEIVWARHAGTGQYRPAKVVDVPEERTRGDYVYASLFIIHWLSQNPQTANKTAAVYVQGIHMFGPHTAFRNIKKSSLVLGPSSQKPDVYLPGVCLDSKEDQVDIRLASGERVRTIKAACFWISPMFYNDAVAYYLGMSGDRPERKRTKAKPSTSFNKS